MPVPQALTAGITGQRGQFYPRQAGRPGGRPRPGGCDRILSQAAGSCLEIRGPGDLVDQAPVNRALPPDPLGRGSEDVGQVPPDAALVGEPGQPAGTGQHTEQRHLAEPEPADGVVDEQDLLAGQREFVAAAGRRPVQGRDVDLTRVAGVLDRPERFVAKFTEIDLKSVLSLREHADIRTGAEHPLQPAGHDYSPYPGIAEAQPLDGIVQFDIDAEVVAVLLQLVAGFQAGAWIDVQGQGRDRAVDVEPPVPVRTGIGGESLYGGHGSILTCYSNFGKSQVCV